MQSVRTNVPRCEIRLFSVSYRFDCMYIMNAYTFWCKDGNVLIVTWGCIGSAEFNCGVAGLKKLCSSGARLCLRHLVGFIGSVVGCVGKFSAAARYLSGRQKITKKVAEVVEELRDAPRYVGGLASIRKTATKFCSLWTFFCRIDRFRDDRKEKCSAVKNRKVP